MKQYFQTFILYMFFISIFYFSVIVIFPGSIKYKYIFIIIWFYLLVALKAYLSRNPYESNLISKFPDLFLVLCISFSSIILALSLLIIILSKHSVFFDFEEVIKLFTRDNIEVVANSTFLSVIILFFLSYNIYKFIYNQAYLKVAHKMKITINYHNLFPYFTVLVAFFGFLPLFMLKFVDSDLVLDKIENYILIFLMTSLVPYIHLTFEKAEME